MTRSDYIELLCRALSEPHGLALSFPTFAQREEARKRLYRIRESERERGVLALDTLSLVCEGDCDLRIIRRDTLQQHHPDDGISASVRSLSSDELPDHFGMRNYTFNVRR